MNIIFNELKTLSNGFELDGELVKEGDPRYQAIVAHIEQNDTPDPDRAYKKQAREYLASTDWYIIREFETGKPTPANIKAARADARTKLPEQSL